MSIFSDLALAINLWMEIRNKKKDLKLDERDRLADLINQMSRCLDEFVEKAREYSFFP